MLGEELNMPPVWTEQALGIIFNLQHLRTLWCIKVYVYINIFGLCEIHNDTISEAFWMCKVRPTTEPSHFTNFNVPSRAILWYISGGKVHSLCTSYTDDETLCDMYYGRVVSNERSPSNSSETRRPESTTCNGIFYKWEAQFILNIGRKRHISLAIKCEMAIRHQLVGRLVGLGVLYCVAG